MNPYVTLGSGIGTAEAALLSIRLTAWHDAMVAHERRLQSGRTADTCDEECPHAEARKLWADAVATFGTRASELTFLHSRATVAASLFEEPIEPTTGVLEPVDAARFEWTRSQRPATSQFTDRFVGPNANGAG